MDTYFAVTAPGLEKLALQELCKLGLTTTAETGVVGGVLFQGELADLYRANLHLRTANRVLVRLGEFHASAFSELRKKASRLNWERFFTPGQPVQLSVTCHRSRLYHSDAVAERTAGAIGDRLGQPTPFMKTSSDDGNCAAQLVLVRLVNDQCMISIDSSGELLHRRGYRLETTKAPLRETLAAAMLLACGWDLSSPLLDPFCGSGTVAIEAAMMSSGLPPGRLRGFSFMRWPGFDPQKWALILNQAVVEPDHKPPSIQASDRDAGAIRIARANAERGGVAGAIEFAQCAISAIDPPLEHGWVVTNPPYGLRISRGKDLRDLYAQLGNVLRRKCPGWQVAMLGADLQLLSQTRIAFNPMLTTVNGGVRVQLVMGQVAVKDDPSLV